MENALGEHYGSVSCAGISLTKLRFGDDVGLLEESEEGLREVTRRLEEASKSQRMEINKEKSKVMVVGKKEDTKNQLVDVMVDGIRLDQVKVFTYLGSRIEENGKSEKEIRIRIGRVTSALAKLDNICRAMNSQMNNKLLLIRVVIVATLLYHCESWTITRRDGQRLRAFEMKLYRRMSGFHGKEKTNEWLKAETFEICGLEPEGVV